MKRKCVGGGKEVSDSEWEMGASEPLDLSRSLSISLSLCLSLSLSLFSLSPHPPVSSQVVQDYDSISRLDNWTTAILLKIKKGIDSDGIL
jgi:hypothetical protein